MSEQAEYDFERLYRDLYCIVCQKRTEHIFCMSRQNNSMVYACMECCHEYPPAREVNFLNNPRPAKAYKQDHRLKRNKLR